MKDRLLDYETPSPYPPVWHQPRDLMQLDYEPCPVQPAEPRRWPTWIVLGLIPLTFAAVGIVVICWAHASYYGY